MTDDGTPPPRRARQGLFLARESYRQRRLRDAARMLPVVGTVCWLIPLLWRRDGAAHGGTAAAVAFVFVAWLVLIVATALIARRIQPAAEAAPDDTP